MLRVVVMVSGGGTNLQAILDAVDAGRITNTEIVGVISNNKNAYALTRAAKGQMGIGGDDSWGSRTHEEYLLKADEKMTFSFVFKGL